MDFEIDFTQIDKVFNRVNFSKGDKSVSRRLLSGLQVTLKEELREKFEKMDLDPFSDEYIDEVKKLHKKIITTDHRTNYSLSDEGNSIEPDSIEGMIFRGLPFNTRNPDYVGNMLMSYGWSIKESGFTAGARLLEPGCGMGSLTEFLVRMGYVVDAVDVSEDDCRILKKRLNNFNNGSRVFCEDILKFLRYQCTEQYDGVIFFQSLHHIVEHCKVLDELFQHYLKEDGIVVLAEEPVFCGDKEESMPYLWGPALYDEALFQMRKNGWMELGFKESYIYMMARHLGVYVEKKSDIVNPHPLYIFCRNPIEKTEDRFAHNALKCMCTQKFVLYGYGKNGQNIYKRFLNAGLKDAIIGICDNSKEKRNMVVGGITVLPHDEIVNKFRDRIFLITTQVYRRQVVRRLVEESGVDIGHIWQFDEETEKIF